MNQFSISHVQDFCFAKQHIGPGAAASSIAGVADTLVGLHSARLSSPYVALAARMPSFRPKDLRHALPPDGSLIKLRCMRRTLHTVPPCLASVVHQATLSQRIGTGGPRNLGSHGRRLQQLRGTVLKELRARSLRPRDLREAISNTVSARSRGSDFAGLFSGVLKQLWEEGELCYQNTAPSWSAEIRRFGLTQDIYPQIDLRGISTDDAVTELIRRYIACYGPVSIRDMTWWTGLGTRAVRRALDCLNSDLVQVSVDLLGTDLWMTRSDLAALKRHRTRTRAWTALLAHEDPSLKGYFETRSRYVDAQHMARLFNSIGEARASVVSNGRVIGTWQWDKRRRQIGCDVFVQTSPRVSAQIQAEVQRLEQLFRDP